MRKVYWSDAWEDLVPHEISSKGGLGVWGSEKWAEQKPEKIDPNEILFACTGTIGEIFPTEKIKKKIPELIKKIRYTQNKYV